MENSVNQASVTVKTLLS